VKAEDFMGEWRIERRIEDDLAKIEGFFTGVLKISLLHDGYLWEEQGQLQYGNGAPLAAARRYLWKEQGNDIEVFFDDGRPFHRFSLGGQAQDTHFCDPDLYRVHYDFSRWPEWGTIWNVQGPRKKYVMHSRYRKQCTQ
jgi:hypothetical protein